MSIPPNIWGVTCDQGFIETEEDIKNGSVPLILNGKHVDNFGGNELAKARKTCKSPGTLGLKKVDRMEKLIEWKFTTMTNADDRGYLRTDDGGYLLTGVGASVSKKGERNYTIVYRFSTQL